MQSPQQTEDYRSLGPKAEVMWVRGPGGDPESFHFRSAVSHPLLLHPCHSALGTLLVSCVCYVRHFKYVSGSRQCCSL